MKSIKHSTKPKKISKAQARREMDNEIAIHSYSKRDWPIPKERIITYGKDLLLMFEEDEEMISILPWKRKYKLSRHQINHYVKLYDEFNSMMEEFKELIGIRAFEKGFYRKADSNFAAKALGMYNNDYREYLVWQNNLKKELTPTQDKQPINVYLQDFGSSGKVPDRIEKESK